MVTKTTEIEYFVTGMKMKIDISILLGTVLLLLSALRLPAPIVEEQASPTAAPEREKAKSTKIGAATSESGAGSKSTQRFDGIWQGTRLKKDLDATYSEKFTLTVRRKSAELTAEMTSRLSNPQGWSYLPEQYRHLSPLHIKVTNHADHVVADRSDLIIRWRGGQLVDWEPKTLPREYAEKLATPQTSNKPNVFTLNGYELVAAGGTIYHRVK